MFSSWFEIQFLQLFPHLAHLIRLGFSAGVWLQVQKTRSAPKYYVTAFRFPRGVPELGEQRADVIEGKVRVVSTSRQLVEQFLRPAHGPRIVAVPALVTTRISAVADRRYRIAAGTAAATEHTAARCGQPFGGTGSIRELRSKNERSSTK